MRISSHATATAASLGATWRTRYYAVRARRLLEESRQQRLLIEHCPTVEMLADTLTKLAAPEVISKLRDAMSGSFPLNCSRNKDTPDVSAASQQLGSHGRLEVGAGKPPNPVSNRKEVFEVGAGAHDPVSPAEGKADTNHHERYQGPQSYYPLSPLVLP